ncbi:1,2-phenylacetyl-CoA epoxidase subunit B [Sulfobacillus harzensis]|uniref:1,2-phenylacetyl-CoA epoxidase subunit B n=1 Tax=Sulfobacillus harzensis TaxID=2729629 RepID=A0A7Y0L7A3_9FIRM|nr:1,2-phenylacetyl-CoA epoxidase subunit B [Sulfobacillus harzensis]NMP23229.1 1,2-phenylacetyl-CoA epoxidase subunit B [Sulfobacillus harzensis]
MERLDFDVYEVFAQSDSMSPHVHVFNVLASSPDMALALAEENFFRREGYQSLWVVRRDHIYQLGFKDRVGFGKTPKNYRTTDDYKYLRDKWRHYREHPMGKGGEASGTVDE